MKAAKPRKMKARTKRREKRKNRQGRVVEQVQSSAGCTTLFVSRQAA